MVTGQAETSHRIDNLTDDTTYIVRVSARTNGGGVSQDAWSAPDPAVTVWSEPTQLWFGGTHSPLTYANGRVWMAPVSNKDLTRAVCYVNTDEIDEINCPPGTLVGMPTDDPFTVSVDATVASAGATAIRVTGWPGVPGGPREPRIWGSGGTGRAVVVWSELPSTHDTRQVGTLDAYVIQHRRGSSGAWTETVITDTTKRSHTITGLVNGADYEIRVRGRTDGDDGDANTTDTARLGITSEVLTVRTSIAYTLKPRTPTGIEVTPQRQRSSAGRRVGAAGGGQPLEGVRLPGAVQAPGDSDWTTSDVIYPRATRRMCNTDGLPCTNPRSYEITGLTAGMQYDVSVRAQNANGWGPWYTTNSVNIPNG